MFALYSPHKNKRTNFRKYNISALEQVFIGIFLLKSRFGTSDILVPMGFYGDCSHYLELPRYDEIYDYEKYKTPNFILDQDNSTLDNVKCEDDNNNFNYTL